MPDRTPHMQLHIRGSRSGKARKPGPGEGHAVIRQEHQRASEGITGSSGAAPAGSAAMAGSSLAALPSVPARRRRCASSPAAYLCLRMLPYPLHPGFAARPCIVLPAAACDAFYMFNGLFFPIAILDVPEQSFSVQSAAFGRM